MSEPSFKSPVKAIRSKCIDCCCGQENEVKLCPMEDCPLWAFRFGKNPYVKKREFTEEQLASMREALARGRAKRYGQRP